MGKILQPPKSQPLLGQKPEKPGVQWTPPQQDAEARSAPQTAFGYSAVVAAAVILGLTACGPKDNEPNVELLQDMMVQPALKAQREEDYFKDHIGARVPPSNTAPLGYTTFKYEKDPEGAGRDLKNPFAGKATDEVLLTGQNFFNTNCMVCHGRGGRGDGPLKGVYPLPIPALISDKVRNWPDGHIYHVITMGQGNMGSYRSHVPEKYRWQVVSYIRHLQKKANESKTE